MMSIAIAPTLEVMRDIYRLSREGGPKSERFLAYLRHAQSEPGFAGYNPMAGTAALEAVEALIALDAEAIALRTARDVAAQFDFDGDITLAVVVASQGMWTDRIATDVLHRTVGERRAGGGTAVFWAREPHTADDVRRESAAESVRIMWQAVHGDARTLDSIFAREGLAYACLHSNPQGLASPPPSDRTAQETPADTDVESAAVTEALELLGQSADMRDIATVLYGDRVAEALGWPTLGLAPDAGLRLARTEATKNIERLGAHAALREPSLR